MPLPVLDVWWQLDEAFDCEFCRDRMVPAGSTIEEAAVTAAKRLLELDWRAV